MAAQERRAQGLFQRRDAAQESLLGRDLVERARRVGPRHAATVLGISVGHAGGRRGSPVPRRSATSRRSKSTRSPAATRGEHGSNSADPARPGREIVGESLRPPVRRCRPVAGEAAAAARERARAVEEGPTGRNVAAGESHASGTGPSWRHAALGRRSPPATLALPAGDANPAAPRRAPGVDTHGANTTARFCEKNGRGPSPSLRSRPPLAHPCAVRTRRVHAIRARTSPSRPSYGRGEIETTHTEQALRAALARLGREDAD